MLRQSWWGATQLEGKRMEEISGDALISLRDALNDVREMSRNGNSADEREAVQYLIRKAEALLEEVGY
jgi:hypothetical protein